MKLLLPAAVVAFTLGYFTTGCGGLSLTDMRTAGINQALDAFAKVVDPLYGAAVLGCDHAEGMIIARSGTTEEQDRASVAMIREHCDPVFAAFQAAEASHEVAKGAVDTAESAQSADSIAAAEAALAKLAATAALAQKAWADNEAAIRRAVE